MSKPKYLYIDDESVAAVEAVRDGFNDANLIEVTVEEPQDFKTQKELFKEKLKYFDGVILDLRLDQNMQLDVSYNAPAIAQELRMSVSTGEKYLKSCPIILCSTDDKMRATYDVDKTSHDLFDYKFLKGSEPNYLKFSKKLCSLAEGYKWLNIKYRTAPEIFGRIDTNKIDPRIIERFADDEQKLKANEIALFIIKEMFHHPGALIKERLVAARLGINIEESGKSWDELRDKFLFKAKYSGLFNSGWDRWWMDIINTFFKESTDGIRLSTINADERVALLSQCLGIKGLIAAKPIKYCKSTNFWTICEGYKSPLDPLEGFRVFETVDIKPWQEAKYISFMAAEVERLNRDRGLRPHPSEKNRIQSIKESFYEK